MVTSGDLWSYLNGNIIKGKDAAVPIFDRGLQWGDAVYDTIRTYDGSPFRLDYRTDRFYRSLYYTRIDIGMTKDELKKAMYDVLEANKEFMGPNQDFSYNYYVSRASLNIQDNGLTPASTVCIIPRVIPFASFAPLYISGAPGVAPPTRRTPPQSVSPKAKISNKMNHTVAELEAKAAGGPNAYAIILDLEGNITESSGSNFLFVSNGRLKVPDTRLVLSGADMTAMLELASGLGIGTDEGTYTSYDLYNAEEAFLTTSSFGVMPIVSFNGLPIGSGKPGPVTLRLINAWIDMVGIDFVSQAIQHLPDEDRAMYMKQWQAMRP